MSSKYCIVGAGPAGLSLSRVFRKAFQGKDIQFEVFEKHDEVGGIWNRDNPGTPIYESAHFISSKTQSGYFDYPMPDHYPDYPSYRQIQQYHSRFADEFGLREFIHFNTVVQHIERQADLWKVTLGNGEVKLFDGVICANGTTWHPNVPEFPGDFDGDIIHASQYSDPGIFKGKRVLVVGAGNSGCDIACDAASHAEQAWISVRRGYHFIPKHIFGEPADVFDHKSSFLPLWLTRPVSQVLLQTLVGDLTQWGLPKPDHKLYETHPIINDQLIHYLRHGDIRGKSNIKRLNGQRVEFVDGSSEAVDLIVLATGYNWKIPYMDEANFTWRGNRPNLFFNLFSSKFNSLFALGFMETNGGAYKLFDQMANLIAQNIIDQEENPRRAEEFKKIVTSEQWDLSGGVKYLNIDRNAAYVNIDAYRKAMDKLIKRMQWDGLVPGMFDDMKVPLNSYQKESSLEVEKAIV